MTMPNIFAATWNDGLFVFAGETRRQELAGHSVSALAPDQNGGALVIVAGHSLGRRTGEGEGNTVATSEQNRGSLAGGGEVISLATADARGLRGGHNGT